MHETFEGEETESSRVLITTRRLVFVAALGLLLTYFVLVGSAFSIAFFDHALPFQWWENHGGNHGPWRHYQPVRSLMAYSVSALLFSVLASLFAAALGERRALWVGAFGIVTIFFDLVFLTWLVD